MVKEGWLVEIYFKDGKKTYGPFGSFMEAVKICSRFRRKPYNIAKIYIIE